MSWYRYRAVDEGGRMKEGRLEAASESAAIQALTGMGLQPFRVKIEGGGARAGTSEKFRFNFLNKATRSGRRRKVWVLTRELAALLHAGLPLPNALQALAREQQDPELKNLLDDCLDQVSSGKGLAQALSAHPEWFDSMYVRLVRAGELVGALDEVLLRLSQDMQRAEQLKGRVRSAMAYPVFLMLAGMAVVSFLMMRVVPTILVILDDLSQNIPLPTKVLMAMTRVFRVSFWPFVILLLLFLLGSKLWVSRVENRKKWDRFRLRIPLLGPMLRSASTTRFARTLSSLLRAGIPLLSGLSVSRGMVNNLFLEETIADAEKGVERGRPLAEALEQSGVFPTSFIYLVRAGEISGELPQLLDEAANIFEEQLERKSERFVSLLEPLLITVLGGLVLLIVMAILLPIFEMNQAAGP